VNHVEDGLSYSDDCPTVTLAEGQVSIFAYGSLLKIGSMESTLGNVYNGPRYPCGLKGWRRSWNVYMPNKTFYEPSTAGEFIPQNIVYLNITPAANVTVNGVLYVLDSKELETFDRREWIYRRQSVERELVGVNVRGGIAFVYIGLSDWLLDPDKTLRQQAAIRQSYLRLIEEGLATFGPAFRASYERSTDPVPWRLVFADRKRNTGVAVSV
jgi:cation transport regulator ChaC